MRQGEEPDYCLQLFEDVLMEDPPDYQCPHCGRLVMGVSGGTIGQVRPRLYREEDTPVCQAAVDVEWVDEGLFLEWRFSDPRVPSLNRTAMAFAELAFKEFMIRSCQLAGFDPDMKLAPLGNRSRPSSLSDV